MGMTDGSVDPGFEMPCLQISSAGTLTAGSPGRGLFTGAWGLQVSRSYGLALGMS